MFFFLLFLKIWSNWRNPKTYELKRERDSWFFFFISIVNFFLYLAACLRTLNRINFFQLDFFCCCCCIFKLAVFNGLSFLISLTSIIKLNFQFRWFQNRMIFHQFKWFSFSAWSFNAFSANFFWFARQRATTMQFQGRKRWKKLGQTWKALTYFSRIFSILKKNSAEQINFHSNCIKIEFN